MAKVGFESIIYADSQSIKMLDAFTMAVLQQF